METEDLRAFAVLARTLNYLEAAEELYLSQPTLTRHIKRLEAALGGALFARTTRSVRLTELGEFVLPWAQEYAALDERFRRARAERERGSGTVVLGMAEAMAPHRLADFFAQFRAACPDIELRIVGQAGQFSLLRSGACGILMADEALVPEGEFDSVPFLADRLVAVVARSHPLAGGTSVRPEQLRGERLLLPPSCALPDSPFLQACRAAGVQPQFAVSRGGHMVDAASLGQCVSILAERPARFFSDASAAVLRLEPEIVQCSCLVFRRGGACTAAERRFLAFVRAHIGEWNEE